MLKINGRDYARLVYCIGTLLCKGSKGCVLNLNSTHIVFKVKPIKPLVKLQWWMQGREVLWALKNPLDNTYLLEKRIRVQRCSNKTYISAHSQSICMYLFNFYY